MKYLPWIGTACVLALTIACNRAPNSPTPTSSAVTGEDFAAADGSTLKANAPGLIAPINDFRLTNLRPTMQISQATGRYVNRTYTYEFQLLNDSGAVINSTMVTPSGSTVSWSYPADLNRDTPYRWRARARLGDAFGPWSPTGRFLTLRENRTPDPPPGGRLPLPNRFNVVQQIAAQNPSLLAHSCQEHDPIGGWGFLDKLIDTLRLEDTRWGYNCKRGNCNDPSLDVIVYQWGPGPDEGKSTVYALDVILGHCGPSPRPAWIDLTDPHGAGARFTSRGRW